MSTPLFGDLFTPKIPSPLNPNLLKNEGMYSGEGIIVGYKNGIYQVRVHGGAVYGCRGVFNMGENIFPNGIAVKIIAHNGEGHIIGRLRAAKDDEADDGNVEIDKPTTVGTAGDATLRCHAPKDDDNTAEVRVTRGNVVSVRCTGSTNIALHPSNELIRIASQRMLAYTDAYRLESGKVTAGTASGIVLDTLTTTSYFDKAGPARTVVIVKNGYIDGTAVHQFSVASTVTASGSTTGLESFKWEIDSSGNWTIKNIATLAIGDSASEPIVLGTQLTTYLAQELDSLLQPHNEALKTICTALALVFNILSTAAKFPPLGLTPFLPPLEQMTQDVNKSLSSVLAAIALIPVMKTQYLTDMGATKAGLLSDFATIQKIAPIPGIVSE